MQFEMTRAPRPPTLESQGGLSQGGPKSNGPDPEDIRLMEAVAAGDSEAQRRLMNRVVERVRRVSRYLLRSSPDAEDAAQLALMEILQSARRFRPPGNLEPWADRIAIRTTLRYARRQRYHWSSVQELIDPEQLASLLVDWRSMDLTATQMRAYLARIPAARREAFVLKHGFGYTVDEVAELTDAPRGTVKDRLVAARRHLRRMIEKDFQRAEPPKPRRRT